MPVTHTRHKDPSPDLSLRNNLLLDVLRSPTFVTQDPFCSKFLLFALVKITLVLALRAKHVVVNRKVHHGNPCLKMQSKSFQTATSFSLSSSLNIQMWMWNWVGWEWMDSPWPLSSIVTPIALVFGPTSQHVPLMLSASPEAATLGSERL